MLGAWIRTAIPIAALIAVLGLRLVEPALVRDLRLQSFDQLQRLSPREYTDVPVRIIDIDDATLARVGQWPWPRTQVAKLVAGLTDLGAAAIAFDVVFAEPDRTAPARVLAGLVDARLSPDIRKALADLPDPDDVLAAEVARAPVVLGFALTNRPGPATPAIRHGLAHSGDDPRAFLAIYGGAVTNLTVLEEAASGNGSFAIERDRDGLIRQVPLLYRLGDELYPALALEALRVALGASTYLVRSSGASRLESFGEQTGIHSVRLTPDLTVPTDVEGRVWLHFTESTPLRYVSAWQVLDGSAPADKIEGHIVFVGTSAAGLQDLRATPLDPVAPGVSLHAELAEQILLGHHLRRPDWALGAELVFTIFWGVMLVLLIRRTSAAWSAAIGVLGLLGAMYVSWLAFRQALLLIDPVFPSLAGAAVYLSGSLANYVMAESERARIRGAFSHYLSPALVKELAAHPELLRLGVEKRPMSVLFADLRGFTSLSEGLPPEELSYVLNCFLTPMTERLQEHRGTIDKYMGDCIMCFWNAPLDTPDHARHACMGALAMVAELTHVNQRLRNEAAARGRPHVPLQIGIGINTGDCCVGNMGSEQRFDYSTVGDEVNLASRLEGQSKHYGVTIVIGDNTRAAVPDIATLELDMIRVKGKQRPVRIHTLMGGPELAASPEFRAQRDMHDEMLRAYRSASFERALELTDHCSLGAPTLDVLYSLYRVRIMHYLEEPPPKDWDFVYTAESK
jgi:adenylate cyclase